MIATALQCPKLQDRRPKCSICTGQFTFKMTNSNTKPIKFLANKRGLLFELACLCAAAAAILCISAPAHSLQNDQRHSKEDRLGAIRIASSQVAPTRQPLAEQIIQSPKSSSLSGIKKELDNEQGGYRALVDEVKNLKKDTSVLQERINTVIKPEVDDLRAKILEHHRNLELVLGVLTFVIVVFAGVSVRGYFRSEGHATASEGRAATIFSVAMNSEAENRRMNNTIFQESQTTLTLVNQTLKLATEASARAAKALETRLRKNMDFLQTEARTLIGQSQAYDDDKLLTQNKDICNDIHRLSDKIEGLENNLIILEEDNLSLVPLCVFIRGADSYLKERFWQAIDYWKRVTIGTYNDKQLSSLANYWLGYVHNNLNQFLEAQQYFREALHDAVGLRKYELRRIELETRFFAGDSGVDLAEELNAMLIEFKAEPMEHGIASFKKRQARILTTLGNINLQIGRSASSGQDTHFTAAKAAFEEGIKLSADIWNRFGLAEALHRLGQTTDSIKILEEYVLKEAENDFINREEKRHKVLAKTTAMMCYLRLKNSDKVRECYQMIMTTLGDVDSRLTIYSQLQKRNVPRAQFLEDLKELLLELGPLEVQESNAA